MSVASRQIRIATCLVNRSSVRDAYCVVLTKNGGQCPSVHDERLVIWPLLAAERRKKGIAHRVKWIS